MSLWRDFFLGCMVAFVAPVIIVAGIVYGVLLLPIVPIIVVIWLVYRMIKKKYPDTPIPEAAKPKATKIKKPIMVKFNGKEMPLSMVILSVIISIIVFIIILYSIIFIIPIGWVVCGICVWIGVAIGKNKKK